MLLVSAVRVQNQLWTVYFISLLFILFIYLIN